MITICFSFSLNVVDSAGCGRKLGSPWDQTQSSLNYFQQHTQITDIMEARSFCSTASVGEEEAGKWICDLVWSYMTIRTGITRDNREWEVGKKTTHGCRKTASEDVRVRRMGVQCRPSTWSPVKGYWLVCDWAGKEAWKHTIKDNFSIKTRERIVGFDTKWYIWESGGNMLKTCEQHL